MFKKSKKILGLFLVIIMLFTSASALEIPGESQYEFINELADYIVKNYKFDINKETLIDAALHEKLVKPDGDFNDIVDAVLSSLDENSSYLTETEYQSLMSHNIIGTFSGIGVTISERGNRVVVVSPTAGSPAQKAGVLPNDIIVSVNGEDVSSKSMDYIRNLIVGEKGTYVNVGFLRGNEIINLSIMRDDIKEIPVTYEVKDTIGYVRITTFNTNVVEAVEEALNLFDSKGITKIAIDLRNNPGGELNEALDLCRLFVPKGVIAKIEYKNSKKNQLFYSENESPKYKLAILVNDGSASASELFTGAVQDTGVGKVIGTNSFGKGTVQQLNPLVSGGCMRLTIAEYLTAGGRHIHKVGLKPDMEVYNTKKIPDISHFLEIDFNNSYKFGSGGKGVLSLEQRLVFLGYLNEADEVFDSITEEALRTYQANNSLTVTGIADVYTLISINNIDYEKPILVDNQLNAALDYLKSL